MTGNVLGVDPGSAKAGYAVVDPSGNVLAAGIELVGTFIDRVAPLVAAHAVVAVALGHGTRTGALGNLLQTLGLPVFQVDEYETTRLARELYFQENPPRGWRRLVPRGMLTPPRPVDDYAAIMIARRYLARGVPDRPPN